MEKIPVIIDTNLTERFAAGIFTALQSKKLDILGITSCFGEGDLESSVKNIAGVLELFGSDIEVSAGADRPFMANYSITPKSMLLNEKINGVQIDDEAKVNLSKEFAPDFIYKKIKSSEKKVAILCMGPITNIALLLQRHNDAVQYIDKIVWCGGTQRHGEIEIVKDVQTYLDPDAVSYVMSYGVDFHVCPLDMGFEMYVTKEEIDAGMLINDKINHQKNRLLKKRFCDINAAEPLGCRNKNLPLQDVAAVLYITDMEIFTTQGFFAEVDRKGKLTYGMFVVHCWNDQPRIGDKPNITLLRKVNRTEAIKNIY